MSQIWQVVKKECEPKFVWLWAMVFSFYLQCLWSQYCATALSIIKCLLLWLLSVPQIYWSYFHLKIFAFTLPSAQKVPTQKILTTCSFCLLISIQIAPPQKDSLTTSFKKVQWLSHLTVVFSLWHLSSLTDFLNFICEYGYLSQLPHHILKP